MYSNTVSIYTRKIG
jgi:hypothetical protein